MSLHRMLLQCNIQAKPVLIPCLSALRGKVATRQGVCHFYATQRRKRLGFQAVLASASDVSTASEFKILNKNVFEDLGADDRVTGRLAEIGVHEATPVQSAAIPAILTGKNVAIQSYTGSGKTLAFLLPVLSFAIQRAEAEYEELAAKGEEYKAGCLQAIIVSPSRELAMQTVRVAQGLLPPGEARHVVQQVIGGANPYRQVEAIRLHKPILVVGTPGRLAELSREGVLQTHPCAILVLDEADQLLAYHFRQDMERITDHVGRRAKDGRQTIVVSATLTPKVLTALDAWCPSPEPIFMGVQEPAEPEVSTPSSSGFVGWGAGPTREAEFRPSTLGSAGGVGTSDIVPGMPPNLIHSHLVAPRRHRVDTLRRAIHSLGIEKALVFMNYQQRLQDTEVKLAAKNMAVASLHGEMGKEQRSKVMAAFRRGDYRALIVSDVIARGLDIPDCDAVFNLELPSDASHYAHRAGRTGRIGRKGMVISIVDQQEKFVVDKLARNLRIKIPEIKLGSAEAGVVKEN